MFQLTVLEEPLEPDDFVEEFSELLFALPPSDVPESFLAASL